MYLLDTKILEVLFSDPEKLFIMRQVVFTLILFLVAIQASHAQWKTMPPEPPTPLVCGKIVESSTSGEGDNTSDYGCLGAGEDPHNGADKDFTFTLTEITDVRFTFEANCIKSIFLLDKDLQCIEHSLLDPDEFSDLSPDGLKVTKTFLGGIRLNPGTYYLMVDGPESSICDAFTLEMQCTPYEPFTICEFGGDISSCNATISDVLPPIRTTPEPAGPLNPEEFPQFNALDFVPCADQSFKVYQAFFDNPGTVTAILSNAPGASVLIYTDECACKSDILCFNGDDCDAGEFSNTGTLNNAPSGYYYFVVIGAEATSFDLQVITDDCRCDFVAEPIECGQIITADAGTEQNKFDNVLGRGLDAYTHCYGRDRPYTGGDKVYQFEVKERSLITIRATSFFNAGIFLFDANCATDCLTYEETSGINGQATINSFEVQKGVYQIIVDLEVPHAASCPFTIGISCEAVDIEKDAILGIQATDIIHQIRVPADLRYNTDDNRLSDARMASIAYFANGNECENAPINDPVSVGASPVRGHELFGKEEQNNLIDAYLPEESLRLVLTADQENQGFVRGAYGRLENFKDKSVSVLAYVSSLTADPGLTKLINVSSIDRNLSSKQGTIEFEIFANESGRDFDLDWCLAELSSFLPIEKQIDILDIQPGFFGKGKQQISVTYAANEGFDIKEVTLRVTGSTINQKRDLVFMQKGKSCADSDEEAPQLNCSRTLEVPSDVLQNSGMLRDLLRAEATGIMKDNCTKNNDLVVSIQNINDIKTLTAGQNGILNLSVTDDSRRKNNATCNLSITVVAPSNRVGNIIQNPVASVNNFQQANPITVMPNPNNGSFNLSLKPLGEDAHELSIFNAFGQRVNNISFGLAKRSQTIPVEMRDYAKGMYFIQLKLGNQIHTKKMIISGN